MVSIKPVNNAQQSSRWLWVLLLATIALTAWTIINSDIPDKNNTIELIVPHTTANTKNTDKTNNEIKLQSSESTSTDSKLIHWQRLTREANYKLPKNLFSVHSWAIIPPVRKVKPAPPSPPVAPPAPFTYMGKMEDGPKGTLIFLIANNRVYSVTKGDQIDAFWRLDGEDSNSVQMTFLPLNLPQVLSKNQRLSAPIPISEPKGAN